MTHLGTKDAMPYLGQGPRNFLLGVNFPRFVNFPLITPSSHAGGMAQKKW